MRRKGGGRGRHRRRIRRRSLHHRLLLEQGVGFHRSWLSRGPLPHQRQNLEQLCLHALLPVALVEQSLALRRDLARRTAAHLRSRRGAS